MDWMQLAIGVGYLVVLLAITGLIHGATLALRDLGTRRAENKKAGRREDASKESAV
jgi:hypothetical protein